MAPSNSRSAPVPRFLVAPVARNRYRGGACPNPAHPAKPGPRPACDSSNDDRPTTSPAGERRRCRTPAAPDDLSRGRSRPRGPRPLLPGAALPPFPRVFRQSLDVGESKKRRASAGRTLLPFPVVLRLRRRPAGGLRGREPPVGLLHPAEGKIGRFPWSSPGSTASTSPSGRRSAYSRSSYCCAPPFSGFMTAVRPWNRPGPRRRRRAASDRSGSHGFCTVMPRARSQGIPSSARNSGNRGANTPV